jgi:hypothetical protein
MSELAICTRDFASIENGLIFFKLLYISTTHPIQLVA